MCTTPWLPILIILSQYMDARDLPHKILFFCVNDFGVKYFNKEDATHLITRIQKSCKITADWTDANFCGFWNYKQGWIDIAMIDYIIMALQKLHHTHLSKPQLVLHQWTGPIYGQKRYLQKQTTYLLYSTKKY